MRNLLSTTDYRRLKMVEYLFHEGKTHIQDLAAALTVSDRILRQDIKQFSNYYQTTDLLLKNSVVSVIFSEGRSIEAFYREVLAQSLSFQLAETIFFNPSLTIDQLSDELESSSSTIYRTIRTFNQEISKRWDIFIDYNPVRMIGNEIDIRGFYLEYFAERSSFFEWPFHSLTESTMSNLVELFASIIQYPISVASFRYGKFSAAVNITRLKQGFQAVLPTTKANLTEIIDNLYQNSEYSALLKIYGQLLELDLNHDTIKQIFNAFVQDDYFYSMDEFKQAAEVNPQIKLSFETLDQMFDYLIVRHHIFLSNRDQLRFHLHNTYSQQRQSFMSSFILNNQAQHFVNMMHNIFPSFTDDVLNLMRDYQLACKGEENSLFTCDLSHILLIHWDNLYQELNKSKPDIQILILTDVLTPYSKIVKQILKDRLPQRMQIDIWDKITINYEDLTKSSHQLIISNFSLPPIDGKKLVIVENFVTTKDIYAIQCAIEELSRNI